ncbi:Gfo/Idh/MocA family oxidoreductase [Acidobacteria bacterium AH-259-D05]|nr:Gfo/Idh/MocA family oxidoreductase [Acidobacteria bacterium AH-259-D05]
MKDADKLVINVIGAGQWGPNLIRNFSNSPHSRVGMICDLDEEKLQDLSPRFPGVELTKNSHEAITDPTADALVITTPVSTHYELARKALLADKHVFVEKPLARKVEECRELNDLARQKERILMVGHVFKFNPGIQYVKTLLQEGTLGKVISMHAIRTNLGPVRSDVNALWDLGSHDLSIFNYWLGKQPSSVTASGLSHLSEEREDTVIANYLYPDLVMATIYASWLHPRKVREITVVGNEKMLVWNDMDLYEPVRIYDKGVDQGGDFYADTFGSFRLTLREGAVTIPPIRGIEPLANECDHFIECVLNQKTPLTDGEDGLAVVRALTAADESMRNNNQSISL